MRFIEQDEKKKLLTAINHYYATLGRQVDRIKEIKDALSRPMKAADYCRYLRMVKTADHCIYQHLYRLDNAPKRRRAK